MNIAHIVPPALAALLLSAPALAADLPVKAKPVEYLRICSAYGVGYYYIPGTDTCLRVGGMVRFDAYANAVGTFNPDISSVAAAPFNSPGAGVGGYPLWTRDSAEYQTRVRTVIDLDVRTMTDYGVLRSYARLGGQWDSQAGTGSPPGGSFFIERAFIQFAGFTFGYTQSFFDSGISYMMTTPYAGSNMWNAALAYTAEFGNGLSATLALEDASNRTTGVQQGPATGTFSSGSALTGLNGIGYANSQDGQSAPEIVANLRVDQAWGSLMVSGALHDVGGTVPVGTNGVAFAAQNSTSSWGWAAGAYGELRLPLLAPGDSLSLQVNYADGALAYLGLSGNNQARATGLGRITLSGPSDLAGGYYPIADAVWTGADYAKETGWAVQAQFRHFWVPNVRSALYAGYAQVDVPANAVFSAGAVASLPGAAQFNSGYDVTIWQAGVNTIWSPVKNLDLGAEVLYSKVDGSLPLSAGLVSGTPAGGTLALFGGSADIWSGGIRAQRNF